MEKTMEKVNALCEMKDRLVQDLRCEVSKGLYSGVCIPELGQVVDMIKDLAEAEEKCMKTCYYEHVIREMSEAQNRARYGMPMMNPTVGYDNWRYSSSGRFAPSGHGHRSGYHDDMMMGMEEDYYLDGMLPEGYRKGGHYGSHSSGYTPNQMYGKAYHEYQNAKRHYTETKSLEDKKRMDTHAMEHMDNLIDSTKEMFHSADAPLKKQMKADIKALLSEMPD